MICGNLFIVGLYPDYDGYVYVAVGLIFTFGETSE
jgi:hypothetical protein